MKERYYFTFGIGHILKNVVIAINGDSEYTRGRMIESFGRQWCEQYTEQEFAKINEYGKYLVIEAHR